MVAALLGVAASLLLSGCSLSTSIQQNAVEYNAAVANYSDQVLLYTILRARDEAPINVLALSTVNGAMSVQGSVGAAVGYSNLFGASATRGLTSAVTPSLQASSSPTWSMASLNTQGFTLGIIQPVAPMYVVSKWTNGLDREFLLRLFIKTIRLREGDRYREYQNNPDSAEDMREFGAKLRAWIPHMTMKILTVLEPIGPPFDPGSITTTVTTSDYSHTPPVTTKTDNRTVANPASAAMISAYEHMLPLDNGPFHVGNAAPTSTGGSPGLQLYREYPQQVVLCIAKGALYGAPLISSPSPLNGLDTTQEIDAMNEFALALKSASKGGAGHAPSTATTSSTTVSGSASGLSTSRPSSPQTSLTTNLKVDRVAAILPLAACRQDELVLPVTTEETNADTSGSFSHVEWRSIAEIIQYLGAIVRKDPASDAGAWQETDTSGQSTAHILFALDTEDAPAFASVDYRGGHYSVRTNAERLDKHVRDHSLQALSLLNELISTAKVSSDIPTSQSIQVLP